MERTVKDARDVKDEKDVKNTKDVRDLRSALELLRTIPGELVETDVEVDPQAELSGVYRHVGAGGTVMQIGRAHV